jgi:light-regulated signal transduction histidine kinase (bacteriophytochrome)
MDKPDNGAPASPSGLENAGSGREIILATLNILEDFNEEKERLVKTQRAMLNILDDLSQSNEEVLKSRDALEVRVKERTFELQQSNVQLEAANRELEAFSYSVSHDLRAPLRAIDGFSQALLEDCSERLDDQEKGYLNRVRDATQRMGQLIDDLLSLARVTRVEINSGTVDLSALAASVMQELREHEPGRDIDFVMQPGLTANGDARLFRQALENLLGNAFKFTSKRDKAVIEFGSRQEGNRVVYFVRDNGVGFDMRYADKLFQPFQRLHSSTEFKGTGIGLATVNRIIKRFGGHIWVEAEIDKGATFYFTIGH